MKKKSFKLIKKLDKSNRIFALDFMRGVCLILMALFHLVVAVYGPFGWLWSNFAMPPFLAWFLEFSGNVLNSSVIGILALGEFGLHYIVVATFFATAGLSTSFSKRHGKSFLKTGLFALALTGATYILYFISGGDSSFLVTRGIFHIFAICYLFFTPIALLTQEKKSDFEIIALKKWDKNHLNKNNHQIRAGAALTLGYVFLMIHLLTINNTIVWPQHVISEFFIYVNPLDALLPSELDNQILLPWIIFFLFGAAASPYLYRYHRKRLQKKQQAIPYKAAQTQDTNQQDTHPTPQSKDKSWLVILKKVLEPIAFCGRRPVLFYAAQIVAIFVFLFLLGLATLGTEWLPF